MIPLHVVGAPPVVLPLLIAAVVFAVLVALPVYPARVRRLVSAASVAVVLVIGATGVRAADDPEPQPQIPILDPCDALPEPYRTICQWLP